MTVEMISNIEGSTTAFCVWFVGDAAKEKEFDIETLEIAEKKKPSV
ncbi:MAG: hypothetical protein JXI43_09000 [Tissierellales bacterium]|nr:hypothetical protein [Tissierellales bacterium]